MRQIAVNHEANSGEPEQNGAEAQGPVAKG